MLDTDLDNNYLPMTNVFTRPVNDNRDLFFIVNEVLTLYQLDYDPAFGEVEEIRREINHMIMGAEPLTAKGNNCWVCGRPATQLHEPAGKKHYPKIRVPLCYTCHAPRTSEQMTWDYRWRKQNQSKRLREAFFLLGLRDLLRAKGEYYRHQGFGQRSKIYETLAVYMNKEISSRLGKGDKIGNSSQRILRHSEKR